MKQMKIVVLHWHGTCPHCSTYACIYVHFIREFRVKYASGYKCDACGALISEDEMNEIADLDGDDNTPCPSKEESTE